MNKLNQAQNSNVKNLINEGNELRREGKLEEAVKSYNRAINLEPNFFQSHHYLGEVFVQQGKLDKAAKSYRQAIELNPEFCWSYHCLGQVLLWQGKLNQAISATEQAIKLNPKVAAFHSQLGKLMISQAIVCQKLKFMYISIPKCACTSLKYWIYKLEFNKEFENYKKDGRLIHIHNCQEFNIGSIRQLSEDKKNYKIITVVRDPIKRFISAYSNRVLYYKELNEKVDYRDKIIKAGLKFDPDINYFIENLEAYQCCAAKGSILHHTLPIISFLGENLSLYTKIYKIQEINCIRDDMLLNSNSCFNTYNLPEIPKTQMGGPKLELNILKPKNFNKLLNYYATDYKILRDYYPVKRIEEEYYSSFKNL